MRVLPAEVKASLYARAEIPEVGVEDPPQCKIEVRSDPVSDGYQTSRSFGSGDLRRSECVESLSLSVDEVLV